MGRGVTFQLQNTELKVHWNLCLEDLDRGALGLILSKLDVRSICSLACTCKSLFNTVFQIDEVWRHVLVDMLPYTPRYLPIRAPTGHRWSDFVKHVSVSMKGPSDKILQAALEDTAAGIVGGDPGLRQPHYCRTTASARTFFAEPDIAINPLLAWNAAMKVQHAFQMAPVRTTRGVQRGMPLCASTCIRGSYPFAHSSTSVVGIPAVRYFEIEVKRLEAGSKLSVGVVHGEQAMRWLRSGTHLGVYSGPWSDSYDSIGWHVHSATVFPEMTDTRWHSRGAAFGPHITTAAVIGCGMDIVGNSIFYTLNGNIVGVVAPSARSVSMLREELSEYRDSYTEQAEAVPEGTAERFLDSLMSLRRSGSALADIAAARLSCTSSSASTERISRCSGILSPRTSMTTPASAPPGSAAGVDSHDAGEYDMNQSGLDTEDGAADLLKHVVHPLDIAHSMFAVSMSGNASATLNLGQRKFVFDLGMLLADPSDRCGGNTSAGDPTAPQSRAASCPGNPVSASALSVDNWRVSVGGQSARSRLPHYGSKTGGLGELDDSSSESRESEHSFWGASTVPPPASLLCRLTDEHGTPSAAPLSEDGFQTPETCFESPLSSGNSGIDYGDNLGERSEQVQQQGLPHKRQNLVWATPGRTLQMGAELEPEVKDDRSSLMKFLSIHEGSDLHDAVTSIEQESPYSEGPKDHKGILAWLGLA